MNVAKCSIMRGSGTFSQFPYIANCRGYSCMLYCVVFLRFMCLSLSMQFDLQRMMIYCDSKHAELETCCDLPNGPVSITGCRPTVCSLFVNVEPYILEGAVSQISSYLAPPWRFIKDLVVYKCSNV